MSTYGKITMKSNISYSIDGMHVKLNPTEREISIAVLLSKKNEMKMELIPQAVYPQAYKNQGLL